MTKVDGLFTRYVGRMFAARFLSLLVFFVIILQMLDMLNKSSDILAAPGADWRSILRYLALRGPQIASQFTPFAALLGIVATLMALNQRSEVTIMRAAGMSVNKVLFPIGFSCLVIACAHFVLHESFVVRTTGKLAYWEANNYAVDLDSDSGIRTDIRIAHDNEIISAAGAARLGDRVRLNDVSVLGLDGDRLARGMVEAPTAIFENGNWRFQNALRLDTATLTPTPLENDVWQTTLRPDQIFAMSINPDQTGLFELARQISELGPEAVERRSATTSFLSRFSRPMSTLVMPLLGAIAGFGVARSGSQLVRAAAGATIGFAYFVAENLMIALGKLGAVPAVFGSFFAFAIFMLVGFAILLTMED